jgi:hypothetical protein
MSSNKVAKGHLQSAIHDVGDTVYARRIDIASGNVTWSEGAVNARICEETTDSTLYDIRFDDGEIQGGIAERDVQRKEDFEWLTHHKLEELKGILPVTNGHVTDNDVPSAGFSYNTILTDGKSFTSVCQAMRAYDDAFVKQNQQLATEEYLNLPAEFNFNTRNGVPTRRSKSRRRPTDPPRCPSSYKESDDLEEMVTASEHSYHVKHSPCDGETRRVKRQRVRVIEEEVLVASDHSTSIDVKYDDAVSSSDRRSSDSMNLWMNTHDKYEKALHRFHWRAKERWNDFSRRIHSEWDEFVHLSSTEQRCQWRTFQLSQHDRWETIIAEETALLKTNCEECQCVHSGILGNYASNAVKLPVDYYKHVQRFEERRQEYLDHFVQCLREDVEYFMAQSYEIQITRHIEFLGGQSDRARYHQRSDEAMLLLHLQDCVNELQRPQISMRSNQTA